MPRAAMARDGRTRHCLAIGRVRHFDAKLGHAAGIEPAGTRSVPQPVLRYGAVPGARRRLPSRAVRPSMDHPSWRSVSAPFDSWSPSCARPGIASVQEAKIRRRRRTITNFRAATRPSVPLFLFAFAPALRRVGGGQSFGATKALNWSPCFRLASSTNLLLSDIADMYAEGAGRLGLPD